MGGEPTPGGWLLAAGWTVRPRAVGRIPNRPRSNSRPPTRRSSIWIRFVTADWG